MKIRINSVNDSNGLKRETMYLDGKESLCVSALCECPEDAIIGRDLVSCSVVVDYMQLAYDAGNKGEAFEIELTRDEKD